MIKNLFIGAALVLLPYYIANATITLPWSTTFDCAEWTQCEGDPACTTVPPIDCDGVDTYLNTTTDNGSLEEIKAEGNNPIGVGKGQRHWYGDGFNDHSGGTAVTFSDGQTELWIRWYQRYPLGFTWEDIGYGNVPHYDKLMYMFSEGKQASVVLQLKYDEIGVWLVGSTSQNIVSANSSGWTSINGGSTGDGLFHYYEFHLKMDTNGTDGVLQVWVDGVDNLVVDRHDLDYGPQTSWFRLNIGSNNDAPYNQQDVPVDYDDIAISNTGYIGPLDSTPAHTSNISGSFTIQ